MSERQKKVDESWKDLVEKQKTDDSGPPQEDFPAPDSFPFFISTLGMQAIAALGELPDPVTGEKRVDLKQAKYIIDVIQMLSDKTKGNLTPDEQAMMQALLYELRLRFVQRTETPAAP